MNNEKEMERQRHLNEQREIYRANKIKKEKLQKLLIVLTFIVLAIYMSIFLMTAFLEIDIPWFLEKFGNGIGIILIGIIVILLPVINGLTTSGTRNKADRLIKLIGVGFIIYGICMLIITPFLT